MTESRETKVRAYVSVVGVGEDGCARDVAVDGPQRPLAVPRQGGDNKRHRQRRLLPVLG